MKNLLLTRSIFLALLLTQFLFACGSNETKNNSLSEEKLSSTQEQIIIDTFTEIPSEIVGCSCYFSNDETAFKKSKYIYADDEDENAYLSINGVMTKFALRKSEESPNNRIIKVGYNENYEITIELEQVGQIDETWQQKGKMIIKAKDGREFSKDIYGECGC